MQESLNPGATPEPGSKLDLMGLAQAPSVLAGPPAKTYLRQDSCATGVEFNLYLGKPTVYD